MVVVKAIQLGGHRIRAIDNGDDSLSLAVVNIPFDEVVNGEVIAGVAAVQFGDIAAKYVWLQAENSNAGYIYVGGAGVTVPNGSADETSGMELKASALVGPIPLDNLNRLYYIASEVSQRLLYFVTR